MAKQKKKRDLPTKVCPVCNRPFTWRKKWAKVWDSVIYCSERCRRRRGMKNIMFVDKNLVTLQMRELFSTLSIQGQSIGAENLQKRMSDSGLTSNELSQGIIAAREE